MQSDVRCYLCCTEARIAVDKMHIYIKIYVYRAMFADTCVQASEDRCTKSAYRKRLSLERIRRLPANLAPKLHACFSSISLNKSNSQSLRGKENKAPQAIDESRLLYVLPIARSASSIQASHSVLQELCTRHLSFSVSCAGPGLHPDDPRLIDEIIIP